MARTVRLADYRRDGETECQYSQKELEQAAVSICDALHGTYKDPVTGKAVNVMGRFFDVKNSRSR